MANDESVLAAQLRGILGEPATQWVLVALATLVLLRLQLVLLAMAVPVLAYVQLGAPTSGPKPQTPAVTCTSQQEKNSASGFDDHDPDAGDGEDMDDIPGDDVGGDGLEDIFGMGDLLPGSKQKGQDSAGDKASSYAGVDLGFLDDFLGGDDPLGGFGGPSFGSSFGSGKGRGGGKGKGKGKDRFGGDRDHGSRGRDHMFGDEGPISSYQDSGAGQRRNSYNTGNGVRDEGLARQRRSEMEDSGAGQRQYGHTTGNSARDEGLARQRRNEMEDSGAGQRRNGHTTGDSAFDEGPARQRRSEMDDSGVGQRSNGYTTGNSIREEGLAQQRRSEMEEPRTELDEILEEALEEENGHLRPADFDANSKRFLTELMHRDRKQGTRRAVAALEGVFEAARAAPVGSRWSSFIYAWMQNFDPDLCSELNQREMERRFQERLAKKGREGN